MLQNSLFIKTLLLKTMKANTHIFGDYTAPTSCTWCLLGNANQLKGLNSNNLTIHWSDSTPVTKKYLRYSIRYSGLNSTSVLTAVYDNVVASCEWKRAAVHWSGLYNIIIQGLTLRVRVLINERHVSIHKTWRYRVPQPVPSALHGIRVCTAICHYTKHYLYIL